MPDGVVLVVVWVRRFPLGSYVYDVSWLRASVSFFRLPKESYSYAVACVTPPTVAVWLRTLPWVSYV